jgi:hypothetical protein
LAGGWFVLREKYRWLVSDKPNEQGVLYDIDIRNSCMDTCPFFSVTSVNILSNRSRCSMQLNTLLSHTIVRMIKNLHALRSEDHYRLIAMSIEQE